MIYKVITTLTSAAKVALLASNPIITLLPQQCKLKMKLFLCSQAFPKCSADNSTVLPCLGLCADVAVANSVCPQEAVDLLHATDFFTGILGEKGLNRRGNDLCAAVSGEASNCDAFVNDNAPPQEIESLIGNYTAGGICTGITTKYFVYSATSTFLSQKGDALPVLEATALKLYGTVPSFLPASVKEPIRNLICKMVFMVPEEKTWKIGNSIFNYHLPKYVSKKSCSTITSSYGNPFWLLDCYAKKKFGTQSLDAFPGSLSDASTKQNVVPVDTTSSLFSYLMTANPIGELPMIEEVDKGLQTTSEDLPLGVQPIISGICVSPLEFKSLAVPFCADIVNYDFYLPPSVTVSYLNDVATSKGNNSLLNLMPQGCKLPLKKMLCASIFQKCSNNAPMPVCRNVCTAAVDSNTITSDGVCPGTVLVKAGALGATPDGYTGKMYCEGPNFYPALDSKCNSMTTSNGYGIQPLSEKYTNSTGYCRGIVDTYYVQTVNPLMPKGVMYSKLEVMVADKLKAIPKWLHPTVQDNVRRIVCNTVFPASQYYNVSIPSMGFNLEYFLPRFMCRQACQDAAVKSSDLWVQALKGPLYDCEQLIPPGKGSLSGLPLYPTEFSPLISVPENSMASFLYVSVIILNELIKSMIFFSFLSV
jgi:hypothetical protein